MGKPEIYIYLYIFIYLTFKSWNLEFSNTIGALKFIKGGGGDFFFYTLLKKKRCREVDIGGHPGSAYVLNQSHIS